MSTETSIEKLYEIFSSHPHVSTDSRNIVSDSIFFALHGERFDGNRFAADALRQGAVLAVVDDESAIPTGVAQEERTRYFKVDDTLGALQALAKFHRRRLALPIIAITGTNGKTTTKELLTAVLSKKFRTSATRGNLNNHIGVPLTLLSLTHETEIGIVEMGASSRGEIALLSGIAQPDYGIITNIGRAHLEGFGGPEGVEAAKGELYDSLCANGGTAFVREDDAVLNRMATSRTGLRTIRYESSVAEGIASRLAGTYNRYNIAAAVAVGRHFGVGEDDIRDAIGAYTPTINRSQVIATNRNTIIADCYNANPSSMQAALEWFGSEPLSQLDSHADGKTIIIGSMLELGAWSREEHARIATIACAQPSINRIFFIGNEFRDALPDVQMPAGGDVMVFADTAEVAEYLSRYGLGTRNAVLLKGSRKMALERLIEYL